MLPKLEFLKLKGLPNLTRFCTGHLIQCCFLQELWIEDCPTLKTFISNSLSTDAVANNQFEETNSTLFDEKVAFSNIEKLRILGMDNLNMIWHTEFHSDSFCKLKVLKVKQGNKLLNIFPPNMLRRFQNLEHLEVDSCASLEEVFDLRSLMRLTSLIVEGCRNLKYLFTTSMVESLAQLKRLVLCDCVSMEEIIIKNGLGEQENVRGMMLPKLEFLKLKGLPNLTRFCTGHLIQCCFLQQLWIEDCPALKTFISNSLNTDAVANNQFEETNSTLFDEKVAFSNIEKLCILGMDNLSMIWHTEFHSDSFCKLKVLKVKQGNKLLNIFPPNMLRRFQNLEHLEVDSCASLEEVFDLRSLMSEKESQVVTAFKLKYMYVWNLQKLKKEIVADEERLGEAPKFVFPKTSSFILCDLPELKSFYPGRHTSEWPVLKKIDVFLCDEVPDNAMPLPLYHVTPVYLRYHGNPIKLNVIPNLEELSLNVKDAEKVCQGQFSADLFHKVRVLELQSFDDASAEFPFGILNRFHNLEKLVVTTGNFKELFPCQLVDEEEHTLARIR
ncbi:hypothetical protein OIU76_016871 [Salix suchowensis]|nr:hypothetical protein OIU76_016871 [Salix suchowensis]